MYKDQVDERAVCKVSSLERDLILRIIEVIEAEFEVGDISRFKRNREGDGYHVFIPITGRRK